MAIGWLVSSSLMSNRNRAEAVKRQKGVSFPSSITKSLQYVWNDTVNVPICDNHNRSNRDVILLIDLDQSRSTS